MTKNAFSLMLMTKCEQDSLTYHVNSNADPSVELYWTDYEKAPQATLYNVTANWYEVS